MAFNVHLPDGRNVNIMTQEGADIFIGLNSDFQGFSSNMEDANRLRQKTTLSNQDKERLRTHYVMIEVLAQNASKDIFKQISRSELEPWLDHAMTVIQKLTNDNRWTRTGILEEHDAFVLNACIAMMTQYHPVLLAFEKKLFTVLAAFIEAVQTSPSTVALPCQDIAETVCMICSNARLTLLDPSNPTQWSSDKTFKKYESSGILVQFLRCSTVPQPREDIGLIKTYEELLKSHDLLKKKFKKGERCGDVVHAILNRKDGHPERRERIMTFLTSIAKLADIMQPKREVNASNGTGTEMMNRMCRHCNKSDMTASFQLKLMACAKCHQAFYCSKECQKADWKKHKPQCSTATSKDSKRTEASMQSVQNFAMRNYADIVEGLLECCDETGLKKEELLVEIDFTPGEDGTIPALSDPPEFIVKDARGYFEASRPNEPDWWYKNEDDVVYKKNIDYFLGVMKDSFERMTTNHILCMVRFPAGVSVYRLQLQSKANGPAMFSNQALDAYRSAWKDQDFGSLSRIFDETQMEPFRRRLGMPGEDDIEKVRRMLNNFGGNFPSRGAGGGSR